MALSIRKRVYTQPAYTEVDETITVPVSFGMFTKAGDKRIAELSAKLLSVFDSDSKYSVKIEAALMYLRKYRSLEQFKSYGEAGDTDVREHVWDFFDKVCRAVNIDPESLWENKEAYPERKVA